MRFLLCTIVLIAGSITTYGQRTEFSAQAGTGLFSFRGPGAVSETDLIIMARTVGNSYGRSSGFSYGAAGQAQRITKTNFIYGVQAGYELLTSQVTITQITGDFYYDPGFAPKLNGRATLQNQYLTVNPFIGKRFGNECISLDVTVGTDLGIGLSSHERGNVGFPADRYHPIPAIDFRPRVNVTGYYRAFGLSLGYSHGLTDYAAGQSYSKPNVYSQMWRASLTYRFRQRV